MVMRKLSICEKKQKIKNIDPHLMPYAKLTQNDHTAKHKT
jgi:hypothetical protein